MTEKNHESRPDVERAVIGCILHDADRAMPVAIQAGMRPDWFVDTTLKAAYTLAERLYGDGKAVDYLTLCAQAKRPESIKILDQCTEATLTVAYLPYYVDMLELYHKHAVALSLAENHAARLSQIHPLEAEGEIEVMQESWEGLGAQRLSTPPLYDLATGLIDEWEKPQNLRPVRVQWPVDELNEIIGGLTDELVYVCAAESVGKTAFVLQFLIVNGARKVNGALASLESSARRLIPRMLSQIARVNTLEIDRGHYTPAHIEKVRSAAEQLIDPGFTVHDRPMTTEQLLAWGRLCMARGAQYLVVDNTRHIQVRQNFRSPVEEMRYISLRLKRMRDELRIPVIALHHANAEGDVSWSKDLRRDVDVLLMLSHNEERSVMPEAANSYRGRWFVDLKVDKCRDGRKGMTLELEFDKEHQTFYGAEQFPQ
jgi:replicative DNA helicase